MSSCKSGLTEICSATPQFSYFNITIFILSTLSLQVLTGFKVANGSNLTYFQTTFLNLLLICSQLNYLFVWRVFIIKI